MADFINTIDVLGDDAVVDSIIDRSITEFKDNTVTKVGDYAFYKCISLDEVELPELTSVGSNAFYNCGLSEVNMPKVVSVGTSAFESCENLKNVNLPIANSNSGSMFKNCLSLESVSMPSLTTTRNYTFNNCKALVSVDLPLLTQSSWNFVGCSKLESICLPSLKTSGASDFDGCSALKIADFPSATKIGATFGFRNCSNLTALILRNSTMCELGGSVTSNFNFTPIKNGTGFVYVPKALLSQYASATNWSEIAGQFRALEDYTVDGTTTGDLDESKI